jgi:HlyD family secretion protein
MPNPREETAGTRKAIEQADVEAVLGLEKRGKSGLTRFGRWFWLLALVGLAGGAVFWWSSSTRTAMRYTSEPATRGKLTVIVTATGSVQPVNKVDVSSELSGTVRKVLVDYNSVVTPGQVLAELDTEKLVAIVENSRAKLQAAVAQVAIAEATEAETQQEYERKQVLFSKHIASDHDVEAAHAAHRRAVATLDSAKAQVSVARSDLQLNDINVAKATIRSPINGVILKRSVDPGQTVAATLQAPVMFTIAEDLRQMELQVDVDEADVGKIDVGQNAMFGVDAHPDRKFPARIRDIRYGSETVQGVVTYKAVLTIDNTELLLRPGMTATAEIVARQVENALLVPNAALRFSPPAEKPDQQKTSLLRRLLPGPPRFRAESKPDDTGANRTIWILQDGIPVAVPVVVDATDGRNTVVIGGKLTEGQQVIVDATTAR